MYLHVKEQRDVPLCGSKCRLTCTGCATALLSPPSQGVAEELLSNKQSADRTAEGTSGIGEDGGPAKESHDLGHEGEGTDCRPRRYKLWFYVEKAWVVSCDNRLTCAKRYHFQWSSFSEPVNLCRKEMFYTGQWKWQLWPANSGVNWIVHIYKLRRRINGLIKKLFCASCRHASFGGRCMRCSSACICALLPFTSSILFYTCGAVASESRDMLRPELS